MEIVQIVLDKKLLQAADQAAKRTRRNRSALVRDALREHLRRLELRASEERDRQGYSRHPQADAEARGWEVGGRVAGRIDRGDSPGEVRLYQFAAPDKKRPALVLTRNSAIAYLSTVTVAPVTSTIRGVPSEVVLNEEDGMKSPCAVNLHNAVTVSQQRLGKRVAQLSSARMNEVCAALRFSLGCDSN